MQLLELALALRELCGEKNQASLYQRQSQRFPLKSCPPPKTAHSSHRNRATVSLSPAGALNGPYF